MSHELRSPLNVINGVSATMLREFAGTKPAESAGLILECGEHLLGIISEILAFSELQGDHARLDAKPFDLLAVTSAALRQLAGPARQKSLELSFWIAPGTPIQLETDPRRLQQILINLLQNAVKFTAHGGVHLSVAARPLPEGRWRWSFSVADSGIGIAPDHLNRLFEPFSQANGEIARTYGGTGLGLAISRSFARLMGGDIVVRSRPGHGSCFRCSIVAQEATPVGRTVANTGPDIVRGRPVRIIAQESRARRLLVAVTKAWGMQPKAHSGNRWMTRVARSGEPAELGIIECGEINTAQPSPAPAIWMERIGSDHANPPSPETVLKQPVSLHELSRALEDALSSGEPRALPPPAALGQAVPSPRLADRVPLRVLAADDIRTNREVLRGMMEYFGYRPDFCVNGAEVLAALDRQSYDLLLLDVQMPVMDGLAAAREIRQRYPDRNRRPRLVALTADALPGDREKCLAAGMDDYLPKPVLPDHIEAGILRWFGSASPKPGVFAAPLSALAPDDHPLIDTAHLAAAFPGMAGPLLIGVLTQLETAALADYQAALSSLEEACTRRDVAALASLLHALKGCFLNIGWKRMAVFCAVALQAARENRFSEWTTLPGQLRELCAASRAAMAQHLAQLGQSEPVFPQTDTLVVRR